VDPTTLAILVAAILFTVLCGGGGLLLLLLLIVGVVLLRRRKKRVTAQEAVKVGAERVSQIFRRTKDGKIEPVRDGDEA
jgi:uncharacterized protein (TIGR03382 family)